MTFTRNLIGESQQRYEQAARLADEPAATVSMLRHAAAVAGCRLRGDDMYRFHLEASDAASGSGDTAGAAVDLATAATNAYRFSSKFVRVPPPEEAMALITEARELAGDDPAAQAAVALAEAGVLTDAFGAAQGPPDNAVPETIARAERAVALARRTGDPLASSAARRWARQLADHPLLAEVGDRAVSWLLVAEALAGNVDGVLTASVRFLEAWQQAGRPARSFLGSAVAGRGDGPRPA